jgi:predicted ABC-type ATPase
MAIHAKANGWKVGIIYIGLRSPNLAVERVGLRLRMGGHNVPSADVRRRYSRSLKNLTRIYGFTNKVLVLDNSSARQPMKRILEANEGRIVFRLPILPKWLRESIDPYS